jgi:hypothetical protein
MGWMGRGLVFVLAPFHLKTLETVSTYLRQWLKAVRNTPGN